jgi:cell division septation protein DedD
MRGVFDEREAERDRRKRNREDRDEVKRDREVTLGSFTLLAILLGLVVLCSLSFGLGFVVGRKEPAALPTVLEPNPIAAQGDGAKGKPSGGTSSAVGSSATGEDSGNGTGEADKQQGSEAADVGREAGAVEPSKATKQVAQSGTVAGHVQPALSAGPAVTRPEQVQAFTVHPAVGQATTNAPVAPDGLMVQVATLAHQDDADVLVEALRRKGYPVAAHRDAVDGMIHVRVGPFASREVANQWRQKLSNDGYNAVVESQ